MSYLSFLHALNERLAWLLDLLFAAGVVTLAYLSCDVFYDVLVPWLERTVRQLVIRRVRPHTNTEEPT